MSLFVDRQNDNIIEIYFRKMSQLASFLSVKDARKDNIDALIEWMEFCVNSWKDENR